MASEAYRIAVEAEGELVGVVDSDDVTESEATLGYWFDRSSWGQGYAYEAARAVTRFAFETAGLATLKAGHAHDNPASGPAP